MGTLTIVCLMVLFLLLLGEMSSLKCMMNRSKRLLLLSLTYIEMCHSDTQQHRICTL